MASAAPLPAWLVDEGDYTPADDREGFLARNALRLTALLEQVRTQASQPLAGVAPLDGAIRACPAQISLLCMLATIVLVTLSRNMAFVWLVLAVLLLALMTLPAARLRAQVLPALAVAALSALLMVPAALMGEPSSVVRMGTKVFCCVSAVLLVSHAIPWNRLVGALRWFRLPGEFVLVLDLAIKDIQLLGQSARELNEAMALRSVGRNHDKTSSAAGVMGVCFLRAHDHASAQAEAMGCRGFDGRYDTRCERTVCPQTFVALALLACLVVVFIVLEGAM